VANCANCGAPLPLNIITCEYCGSRNDTDLKGVHRYTTHELDEGRTCPRCVIALRTIDLNVGGKFLVERCDRCLGLFFDPGELEALLAATVTNVFTINRKQLDSLNAARRAEDYAVAYVKCPVCATVMSRVNYGTRSGVIVDRCPDHGIWLDGGELRQLFEWTKAGGGLLEKQRQEAKLREAEREIAREGRWKTEQPGKSGGYLEREADRGLFGDPEPDLFDMLRAVARFFS
jgi:Zn-finger nucleic acid-binding protein